MPPDQFNLINGALAQRDIRRPDYCFGYRCAEKLLIADGLSARPSANINLGMETKPPIGLVVATTCPFLVDRASLHFDLHSWNGSYVGGIDQDVVLLFF